MTLIGIGNKFWSCSLCVNGHAFDVCAYVSPILSFSVRFKVSLWMRNFPAATVLEYIFLPENLTSNVWCLWFCRDSQYTSKLVAFVPRGSSCSKSIAGLSSSKFLMQSISYSLLVHLFNIGMMYFSPSRAMETKGLMYLVIRMV